MSLKKNLVVPRRMKADSFSEEHREYSGFKTHPEFAKMKDLEGLVFSESINNEGLGSAKDALHFTSVH